MFKKLFALVVVVGMCCSVAFAQEAEKKAGPSISQWLKGLQLKIASIAPKKTAPQGTIVAGVRGAKGDASTKLYWKGKKGEEPVTEEEMTGFKKGVDLAMKGDKAGATKELSDFMKQYPDSPLIPDAKKTLDLVKVEMKDEVKPAATPEVKTEVKPEVKAEVKPEVKPEAKPEVTTEVKAAAAPEVQAEVKPEAAPEAKPEVKAVKKKKKQPVQQ
jgi:hypothetical protein